MLEYSSEPLSNLKRNKGKGIPSFVSDLDSNIDRKTVDSFGEEWLKFKSFSDSEIKNAGDQYFDILNIETLKNAIVLDMGCGSGRWTKYIAPSVNFVEAIDPSEAVFSAEKLTESVDNVRVTQAGVDSIPFQDNSFDLVICLGVLHHIPDTSKALKTLVRKMKVGGVLLLYLYYKLDNRGILYKLLFRLSHFLRLIISMLPTTIKKLVCDVIAVFVYLPLVLLVKVLQFSLGKKVWIKKIPLSYYSGKSFNIIRNDALDRFGTPLEQRFSKKEIIVMMQNAGLSELHFSTGEPYWHMTGQRVE